MKITLLSLVLCLFCSLNMEAQGSDIGSNPEDTTIHQLSKKELRRQKVAKRNIHYNILGGPSYTPDFGALIGGSALVTFRMNPSDTLQKRSVLPMAVAVMFEGGLNLMVKPQLFFKNDKFRIFGKFTYKNTLENFYGIGYATNKHYERSDSTSEYLKFARQFSQRIATDQRGAHPAHIAFIHARETVIKRIGDNVAQNRVT